MSTKNTRLVAGVFLVTMMNVLLWGISSFG